MNYAILLSGGIGSRLGLTMPKQYYEVNQKPIIRYVIETLEQSPAVDGIVIVAAVEWQAYIKKQIVHKEKFLGFAVSGENRQLSIYNGLCKLREICSEKLNEPNHDFDTSLVLIQDAARPNTSLKMISDCFALEEEEDGAMPVLPMKDTVYSSTDGLVVSGLLQRETIFAGQAPECFRLGKYFAANESLMPEQILSVNGSTEPAILAGMNIKMITGDENNYKITTQADLERFKSSLK